MNQKLNVLVYPRTSKTNSKEECPLYGRIVVDGNRVDISLRQNISIDSWDKKRNRLRGKTETAFMVNEVVTNFISKTQKIFFQETEKGNFVSAQSLRNLLLGTAETQFGFVNVFKEHMKEIKARIGKDFTSATHIKYTTTSNHLTNYLAHSFKRKEIFLKELNYTFISGFEHFLKTEHGNTPNSVNKHIQRIRKVIRISIANGWLDKDPFSGYSIKTTKTTREFLSEGDLKKLEEKQLTLKRLSEVRDFFVFSCYTGISYVDIFNLKKENLSIDSYGDYWIRAKRHKTGTPFVVFVLPKALEIIEKFSLHREILRTDKLIPIPSNQKINAYLKEIATLCEISTNLTFHVARHTFATTIALTNGVPMETVSKILGHTNIKTTQIYGKILEKKVGDDMRDLKYRLALIERINSNSRENICDEDTMIL